MRLRNAILAGLMFGMAHGVSVNAGEDKITKGYNSMDAMGCMLVRECTKDVEEVHSLLDISVNYPNVEEFTPHAFCLLYTSPSPRDRQKSRMPSSA